MSELSSSAQIIPFPVRPPADKPTDQGAARLARARAALDAALGEQRVAIAAWRDMLLPAFAQGGAVRLWPFEGPYSTW